MKIRVLLVDHDINFLEEVKQYLSSKSNFEVVGVCSNEREFLEVNDMYDTLVLNMLLSDNESLHILDSIKLKNKKVIVTSEFVSEEMMRNINSYNPDYFIKKPMSLETLEKVISDVSKVEDLDIDNTLKVDITNLLHSLGIPSHIKGYNYIRDGIQMVVKNSKLGSMTKEIYPSIASYYDTTSSRVERAMRHAIEVSWVRGDYSLMEEIFGNSIDFDRSKPTNSEFIATLADRLVLSKNYTY